MDTIAHILTALAEPRRRAIVELLAGGERCLCDISRALAVSDQLASHHVKHLRDAGLVQTSRRGTWMYCRLDPEMLGKAAEALRSLADRARSHDPHDAGGACCAPAGTDGREQEDL